MGALAVHRRPLGQPVEAGGLRDVGVSDAVRSAPRRRPAGAAAALDLAAAERAQNVAGIPEVLLIEAEAIALPEQSELTVPAVRRCPYCGWIESKREVLPSTADPRALRAYEYTVRMADGSASVFLEVLPTSWRLRERLIVIGGARPLD